jgi:hypothetical protein
MLVLLSTRPVDEREMDVPSVFSDSVIDVVVEIATALLR